MASVVVFASVYYGMFVQRPEVLVDVNFAGPNSRETLPGKGTGKGR